jgi:RHS repeat-associated protein
MSANDPAYDRNGNLTFDGSQKYTYDAWNRMVKVAHAYRDGSNNVQAGQISSTSSYDGRGRRISKTLANTGAWDCAYHYYYDGDSLAETRNGSDILMRQHVWGTQYIDELVQIGINQHPQTNDPGGNVCQRYFWTCQDANYNVLGVVMSNGRLVERYEYTPYGQRTVLSHGWYLADVDDDGDVDSTDSGLITAQWQAAAAADSRLDLTGNGTIEIGDVGLHGQESGWSLPLNDTLVYHPRMTSYREPLVAGQPLCEVGHQGLAHDEESGLVYNRARQLHPALERFAQRDPLSYSDGPALYAYVRDNPSKHLDPLGLCTAPFECSEANCTWDVTISASAVYAIFGRTWVSANAWGRDDTNCVYHVSGEGSAWFTGGATFGVGHYSISGSKEGVPAPCKWPLNKGSLISIAWGELNTPILGELLDLEIVVLEFTAGGFHWMEELSWGSIGAGPGGIHMSFAPVNGGVISGPAESVVQEGPWMPAP